jgi:hypothetical protein
MRLREISIDGYSEVDPIVTLKRLYDTTGSCVMNGLLGEELKNCNFDENGVFEFTTDCENDDVQIHSQGAVLSDSVLIKQTQKDHNQSSCHLYSWDLRKRHYTFLSIQDEEHLNRFYNRIKRTDTNLCQGDISKSFQNMGLTFDAVNRVYLNQSIDPLHQMFDDEFSKEEKESSFVM